MDVARKPTFTANYEGKTRRTDQNTRQESALQTLPRDYSQRQLRQALELRMRQ